MAISQKLIKIIAFRLCHFEDIDAEIECHPLESDTRGGPPPRSYATELSMSDLTPQPPLLSFITRSKKFGLTYYVG